MCVRKRLQKMSNTGNHLLAAKRKIYTISKRDTLTIPYQLKKYDIV